MFFSISKTAKDNFVESHQCGLLYVNVDAGWAVTENESCVIYYKGYADSVYLPDAVEHIVNNLVPVYTGNFCCIAFNKNSKELTIRSDKYRSFPIYLHAAEITNLIKSDKVVFSDSTVDISQNLDVVQHKFNLIGNVDASELPYSEVRDRISCILDNKTKQFLEHNKLPIKTYLSGGVDSLLVFTLLNKFTKAYSLVKGQYIDYDKFWMLNSQDLQKFWGYKQIHHWIEPTILTSGAPGDEFMLRSPYTSDAYLNFIGLNLKDLSISHEWKDSLHALYFLNADIDQKYTAPAVANPNKNKTIHYWNLCNNVVNDWQHWHLGNTLTWTPLRDLEIFKLMLQLPYRDALDQMFNSKLSIDIIEQNFPGARSAISDRKNSGVIRKNLLEFYNKLDNSGQ